MQRHIAGCGGIERSERGLSEGALRDISENWSFKRIFHSKLIRGSMRGNIYPAFLFLLLLVPLLSAIPYYNYMVIAYAQATNTTTTPVNATNTTPWWQPVADAFGGFINALTGGVTALAELLRKIWDFIVASGETAKKIIESGIEGLKMGFYAIATLGRFLGNPGDPGLYSQLTLMSITREDIRYWLSLCATANLSDPFIRSQIPYLNNISWIPAVAEVLEKDPGRGNQFLCDIVPSGFVGMISWPVWIATSQNERVVGLVTFIIRNIFFIIIATATLIIVVGMERAIRTRDPSKLYQALEIAWKIIIFPAKVVWFIIQLLIRLAQAIFQMIQAVKPI